MSLQTMARWRAAVALQYEVAPQLLDLRGDAYCAKINPARWELDQAWRGLPADVANSDAVLREWEGAYNVVRDVELEVARRSRREDALATVESTRLGVCAVLTRIPELCDF